MSVSSNGIGTGCTFHIDLPLARKETSNALNPSVMDEKEQDIIKDRSNLDPPTVGIKDKYLWPHHFSIVSFLRILYQHFFSIFNQKIQPNNEQKILHSSCINQVDKECSRMSRATITVDGFAQSNIVNNHFPTLRNESLLDCNTECRRNSELVEIVSYDNIHRTVGMLSD